MLQQQGAVALLLQASLRAHGARQQPHHAVDDRHRRQLTAGEHEITDRHLLIGQGSDALIEALVVAAEEHQLVAVRRPAAQVCLLQGAALGTHQQHPPPRQHGERLHRRIHRFGLEHHAGAAAIGLIVDFAVAVCREIAWVMDVQLGDAGTEGPPDHSEAEQRREGLRRQAHHVESHQFSQPGPRSRPQDGSRGGSPSRSWRGWGCRRRCSRGWSAAAGSAW